jgi:hypothetical protein
MMMEVDSMGKEGEILVNLCEVQSLALKLPKTKRVFVLEAIKDMQDGLIFGDNIHEYFTCVLNRVWKCFV